jgi:hypothetical protein
MDGLRKYGINKYVCVVYVPHNGILFNNKEGHFVVYPEMDGIGEHYVK